MTTRRELLSMGCALAATAMLPGCSRSQLTSHAKSGDADPMSFVNPEFRAGLERLHGSERPQRKIDAAALKQMRASMDQPGGPLQPSPAVTERLIPGAPGAPLVRIYVAGNAAGAGKPAVLHIHGGGYIMVTARGSRQDIQELAATHNCVAVTVDYRLAPETRFPGSLEDIYAALRWMHTNANELGIDVARIAVKGESSGGGHAAALTMAARDRGEFPLCLQVLLYPMLDDRTGSSRQLPPHIGHYIWTAQANRFGWSSLLGVPAGSDAVPSGSVPARAANLVGLPPAFIGVGSIDLFAPEDLEYAQRLIAAGVPTEVSLVPGGFHAFDLISPEASLSRQFKQAWNEAIRRAFSKA
ncbi:MAG: alpha/beta hydrolase [Terracidiphilus sp.]|nr:alpha/beta hydrolase [Terracidiphilus sp.]